MLANLIAHGRLTADLDNGDRRILSQPIPDYLFSNPCFEPPYIRILKLLLNDFIQPLQASIVSADPLVKLKIQPSQRSAILELGLVVDVCCPEAVNLYAAYDLFSLHSFSLL